MIHEKKTLKKFFFCLTFIYFLFWGCIGSWLRHRGSFVAARGLLSSCGMWVFLSVVEAPGSVVAARGISCPLACGILVPRPGIKPVSPSLEGRFFTTGPPGRSQEDFHKLILFDFYGGVKYSEVVLINVEAAVQRTIASKENTK